jgi:adenylate cyclase
VAYFGAMGSEGGLVDISAIGDEVNTAARIASKAVAGEILVSEAALAQAGVDAGELESRKLELKGISGQVSVRVMHARFPSEKRKSGVSANFLTTKFV